MSWFLIFVIDAEELDEFIHDLLIWFAHFELLVLLRLLMILLFVLLCKSIIDAFHL
jgi:hypothetical protein